MNSLLGSQPIVLFVVVFLAALVVLWRLLSGSRTTAKHFDWSARPKTNVFESVPVSSASSTVVLPSSDDALDASNIVAEVCSLRSPAREDVANSYHGRHVRWTLSLSAISEREGAGETHIVRMYPSGRSPFSCGVYFTASAAECAALQTATKEDAFVVEGVIDKVEDRDIDLTDVRMVEQKAA